MKLLLTGATGKVGRNVLSALEGCPDLDGARMVALCNNRTIDDGGRLEVVRGSLSDADTVRAAASPGPVRKHPN